jgi:membrane-associated phospholipid phosphatase
VFPSGHTFGPTAVGTAAAYVLARERVASPGVAAAVALGLPAVAVTGRLLARRHWASDVLGGWLGGVAVAAACLAVAELAGD